MDMLIFMHTQWNLFCHKMVAEQRDFHGISIQRVRIHCRLGAASISTILDKNTKRIESKTQRKRVWFVTFLSLTLSHSLFMQRALEDFNRATPNNRARTHTSARKTHREQETRALFEWRGDGARADSNKRFSEFIM